MSDRKTGTGSRVIPTLRYTDGRAAVDWLCRVLGFEQGLVVEGEDGRVEHAQLLFSNGMVMLGSARPGPFDALVKPPGSVGGIGTQSVYLVVEDVEAHHARAREAGAEIVMPLEKQDYGGSSYSCRDPEGHVWNFGSYDPWRD